MVKAIYESNSWILGKTAVFAVPIGPNTSLGGDIKVSRILKYLKNK